MFSKRPLFSSHEAPRRDIKRRPSRALALEVLEPRHMLSVNLLLDYSLDNGFFINSQPHRDALQAVATEIGARLNDTLPAVPTGTYPITNPQTGGGSSARFNVPANAIRIFVSGSSLPGSTAGEGGWQGDTGIRYFDFNTDVEPYAGYVRFDDDSTIWDFGSGPGFTFAGVARHELLHVLGIGTNAPTWNNLISNGYFTGPQARAANGGLNPQVTVDKGHFAARRSFDHDRHDHAQRHYGPGLGGAGRHWLGCGRRAIESRSGRLQLRRDAGAAQSW